MEIKMPEYIDLNVIPHLRDIRYISLDIFKIKKKKPEGTLNNSGVRLLRLQFVVRRAY
jgi:hypothetical protein